MSQNWPPEVRVAVEDALADYGLGLGATYEEAATAVLSAVEPFVIITGKAVADPHP